MKTNNAKPSGGFTLIELLVVVVIAVVLAILLWPSTRYRRPESIMCVSNLKQIGLGFRLYAEDNHDRFPFQTSVTNSGVKEFVRSNQAFPYFQSASFQLGKNPKVLHCPSDTKRNAAAGFEMLNDSNLSYFLNVDATWDSTNMSILAGDRFLQNDGRSVQPGLLVLTTNLNLTWKPGIHKEGGNINGGNLLFADGSVQQTDNRQLGSAIQNSPLATNRLLIP